MTKGCFFLIEKGIVLYYKKLGRREDAEPVTETGTEPV